MLTACMVTGQDGNINITAKTEFSLFTNFYNLFTDVGLVAIILANNFCTVCFIVSIMGRPTENVAVILANCHRDKSLCSK